MAALALQYSCFRTHGPHFPSISFGSIGSSARSSLNVQLSTGMVPRSWSVLRAPHPFLKAARGVQLDHHRRTDHGTRLRPAADVPAGSETQIGIK